MTIASEHDVQRLVEVSRMYYDENLTQDEIGKRLGVSRALISKMLTRAREIGIVSIRIRSPYTSNGELLSKLATLFHLRDGIIVPEANSAYMTQQVILNHAVHYIRETFTGATSLGVGWGPMMGALVARLESVDAGLGLQGEVCPLIGGSAWPSREYHPNELVRLFAEKTGLSARYLYAPAFPATEHERELFMATDNFREIIASWSRLNAVIFGIDAYPSDPDQATAARFGRALAEKGAVGEFLSYYFDRDGRIIAGEQDHAIRIPLQKLPAVTRVVAIGSGNAEAIAGALRTGFITTLISDERTAAEIIKAA